MKKMILSTVVLSCAFVFAGCNDAGQLYDGPVDTIDTPADGGVDVDIHVAEDRADRQQERRENLREAIEDVDVEVGDGEVDVKVD